MTNQSTIKIGVFWVYQNTVIGRARDLDEGFENVPGLIDSPDDHFNLWENDTSFVIPFSELIGSEYQEVPRGRVLYSRKDNASIIYMDKSLHTDNTKQAIVKYFNLSGNVVVWLKDQHYTTDQDQIDQYFTES